MKINSDATNCTAGLQNISRVLVEFIGQEDIRELSERVAEWLRRLTRKAKVRTAVGSNPTLDSLVAVRNTSPGRPEPCEGNLVAVAGSCGGLMVKHPWPLLEISRSDFRGLATLNINTYLPTYLYENPENHVCCTKFLLLGAVRRTMENQ